MTELIDYLADRFTIDENGCWIWTLSPHNKGYGQIFLKGHPHTVAHRAMYETVVGPLPAELTLDHLCLVKMCVNPDHVEDVTGLENTRRWAARDLCRKGHSLTPENTTVWSGVRRCTTCVVAHRDEKNARRRSRRAVRAAA